MGILPRPPSIPGLPDPPDPLGLHKPEKKKAAAPAPKPKSEPQTANRLLRSGGDDRTPAARILSVNNEM
jgi:hypothetical protein